MSEISSRLSSITIEPHPKIMDELTNFLESKGHECVRIEGINNYTFKWCQKDICLTRLAHEQMDQREKENIEFAEQLSAQGHTCIHYLEKIPIQISWCHENPCKNNKGG
jgi:hypothetical protein